MKRPTRNFVNCAFLFIICINPIWVSGQIKLHEIDAKTQEFESSPTLSESLVFEFIELIQRLCEQGNLDKAEYLLNEFNMKKKHESYVFVERTLHAILSKYKGQNKNSKQYFLQAQELLFKRPTPIWSLYFFTEYAEYYRKIGLLEDAESYISKGDSLVKMSLDLPYFLEVRFFNRKAAILNERNNLLASISNSKLALTLARDVNDEYMMGVSYNELGFSYKNQNKILLSESHYEKAIEEFKHSKSNIDEIHATMNLAQLYLHNQYKWNKGHQLVLEVLNKIEKEKIDYPLWYVHEVLYLNYKNTGQFKKALEHAEKRHTAYIQFLENIQHTEIQELDSKFNNTKLLQEKAQLNNQFAKTKTTLETSQRNSSFLLVSIIFLLISVVIVTFVILKTRRINKQLKLQDFINKRAIGLISHDLKGSMYTLSILSNRARQKTQAENQTELNDLEVQLNSTQDMLDSLLNWLRSTVGNQSRIKSSKVTKACDLAISDLKNRIEHKGIEIIQEINDPESRMKIPHEVLRVSIRNILSNAIKYSYDRATILITIDTDRVSVQDFGVGITKEQLAKFFKKGITSTNGTNDEEGYGIGMFLTSNLLSEHQYTITVDSTEDQGTTFTIIGSN